MEDAYIARIAYLLDELTPQGIPVMKIKERGMPTPWETLGNWRL